MLDKMATGLVNIITNTQPRPAPLYSPAFELQSNMTSNNFEWVLLYDG